MRRPISSAAPSASPQRPCIISSKTACIRAVLNSRRARRSVQTLLQAKSTTSPHFFQKIYFLVYERIIYFGSEYKGVDYITTFPCAESAMPDLTQLTDRQREIHEFIRD